MTSYRSSPNALQFFTEAELQPTAHPVQNRVVGRLLTDAELDDLDSLSSLFANANGRLVLDALKIDDQPHVRAYISVVAALGAVTVRNNHDSILLQARGRFALHILEILSIYLRECYAAITDWNRTSAEPQVRISAVDLLQVLESRRVEQSVQSGYAPRILAERPVAFAIIRATDNRGRSCFLFEVNRDWHRLNFIGGKQEAKDRGDFAATLRREIGEELGIAADRLSLTRLNDDPLIGYSISGNAGSLARYPCVLFGVTIEGPLNVQLKNRWLTEDSIRRCRAIPDGPLGVNPTYLSYLLDGRSPHISRVPMSTSTRVHATSVDELVAHGESRLARWARVASENKDLIVAAITLLGAMIGVLAALIAVR